MLRTSLLVGLLVALAGCSSVVAPDDGGRDAPRDSVAVDAGGCLLPGGSVCAVGATCPAGDGCNSCTCSASGMAACTLLACTTPGLPCGSVSCDGTSQYCAHTTSDTGGPDSYRCMALPSACVGARSCACVASVPCGSSCMATTLGVTVTCWGG